MGADSTQDISAESFPSALYGDRHGQDHQFQLKLQSDAAVPPPPAVATTVPAIRIQSPPPPQVVDRLTIPIETFTPAPPLPHAVIVPRETRPERPRVDRSCQDSGACGPVKRAVGPMLYDTPEFKNTYGKLPQYQQKAPIENDQGWVIDQSGRRVPGRHHVQDLGLSQNGTADGKLVIPGGEPIRHRQRFSAPEATAPVAINPAIAPTETRPRVAPAHALPTAAPLEPAAGPKVEKHFSPPPPDGSPLAGDLDTLLKPILKDGPPPKAAQKDAAPPPVEAPQGALHGFVPVEQRQKEVPAASPPRVENAPAAAPAAVDSPKYGRLPTKSPGDAQTVAPTPPVTPDKAPQPDSTPAAKPHGFTPVENR